MEGKHWFRSKTVWVNVTALVAAVGLFVQGGMTDFNLLLPAAMGVVNVVLRLVTNQPID